MSVVMNVPGKEIDLGDNCVKNVNFDFLSFYSLRHGQQCFSYVGNGSSWVEPVLSKD